MPYKLAINTATHAMPMVDILLAYYTVYTQSHMKLKVTQIAPSVVTIGKTPLFI